jgi:hypothetical protein
MDRDEELRDDEVRALRKNQRIAERTHNANNQAYNKASENFKRRPDDETVTNAFAVARAKYTASFRVLARIQGRLRELNQSL